ncbi:High mobility group box domain superfamily [Arabidopsis thaliana x Arabidopsis arenosa]|uniref:High mobility group box domain superfamily n=1 Tax=Arabidopsis thaliana x Arabidopsis arenosa TaxID=1240361 RepID=A0A8T1YAJ0_9BRAS|nr:High mobility group box domain superfamily [Arabidopsis thaliana x Arabidopsis arenosa]
MDALSGSLGSGLLPHVRIEGFKLEEIGESRIWGRGDRSGSSGVGFDPSSCRDVVDFETAGFEAWPFCFRCSTGTEQDDKGKGSPVEGVVQPGALVTLPPPREVARPEVQRQIIPSGNLDEEEWVTVYGFSPGDNHQYLNFVQETEQDNKKKNKKEKDPLKPKHPIYAFLVYANEKWKNLSDKKKAPYEEVCFHICLHFTAIKDLKSE